MHSERMLTRPGDVTSVLGVLAAEALVLAAEECDEEAGRISESSQIRKERFFGG